MKSTKGDSISVDTMKAVEAVFIILGFLIIALAGANSIIENYTDRALKEIDRHLSTRQ